MNESDIGFRKDETSISIRLLQINYNAKCKMITNCSKNIKLTLDEKQVTFNNIQCKTK